MPRATNSTSSGIHKSVPMISVSTNSRGPWMRFAQSPENSTHRNAKCTPMKIPACATKNIAKPIGEGGRVLPCMVMPTSASREAVAMRTSVQNPMIAVSSQ